MKFRQVLTFVLLFVCLPTLAQAYWVWSPEEGKFVNSETESQDAADEQYHYAMQFYNEKNLDEAIKQLERLLENYPGAPVAAEAQYRLGVIHEEKDDFGKAFNAYKKILESYPQSDRLHEVIEREFRIGNLFLSGKKGKLMGLEILPSNSKAVEVFKHIVDHAPYSDYGDKAQLRLGLTYKKMGKFAESMEAFQALLDQYPQSDLLEEARFQLAQTSFQRSTVQFRDQRALDDASTQIDSFLTQYPDAATSEEAARLRQEIDEKNAEKNYRIGLYYEKTNYVQSALIYYSDVARRYPHTKWGQKSADKMKSLEAPAEHITQAEKEVRAEIENLEQQMEAADKGSVEYSHLKRMRERLDKKQENVEKNKEDTLKSRRDDLNRREAELKEKYRNLKKKQKLLKKNPSDDLKNALERWELSLEAEKAALGDEKGQVADWHHALGVKMERSPLDLVPFVGEDQTEIERVRAIEAKKFFKLANEKKELLSQKELLYKHHSEVLSMLGDTDVRAETLEQKGKDFAAIAQEGTATITEKQKQLESLKQEIAELEKEVAIKRTVYEKEYGSNWNWLKDSHKLVTAPAVLVANPIVRSIGMINPFDSSSEQLEDLTLDQLLERQMHIKEKIAAQQSLVDTLAQAFDSELALKERQRLLDQLESKEQVDPQTLRKEIRQTERNIRGRYEEIKDRHNRKKDLLKELDAVVKNAEDRQTSMDAAVTKVTKPASGVVRVTKAFFFGLEPQDVTLTKQAASMKMSPEESESAVKIREALEQESLLIEARHLEIKGLEKELEILKARASLAGGYNFRSALVKLPYSFIREAVESANRLLPKEGKEEALIGLLDKETQELAKLQQEAANVKARLDIVTSVETPAADAPPAEPAKKTEAEIVAAQAEAESAAAEVKPAASAEEDAMRRDIEASLDKLKSRQKAYETERDFLKREQKAYEKKLNRNTLEKLRRKEGQVLTKEEEILRKELEDIESTLQNLIQKENSLEEEESSILWKRIELIDKLSQKMASKAMVADLLVERKRMEERLEQIDLRRDFLTRERERFQLSEFPTKA